jgi:hypothetical protein
MAIEAMYQTGQMKGFVDPAAKVHGVAYRLRNVMLNRATIMEGDRQQTMFTLSPERDNENSWNWFSIFSLSGESSMEHCTSLIATQDESSEGN